MSISTSSAIEQQPAILGGPKVRTEPYTEWPVAQPYMMDKIKEVMDSGKWGVGSPYIEEFEKAFAQFIGVEYCGSCVNGTEAITVALRAAGIRQGDEILTSPYTFIGTITPIMGMGCVPRFVDIHEDTFLMDPDKIEGEINEHTKAIIPVHIAGCPVNMDRILEIAKKHNLVVLEDCAQAHGAEWKGKRVGSIGDLGTFSFQTSKNMSSGEGGAVTTNSLELSRGVFAAKNCGRVPDGVWYGHELYGTNLRLSAIQAAILIGQICFVDEQNAKRHENATYLESMLSEVDGIQPIAVNPEGVTKHAHHLVLFRYDSSKFEGLHRNHFLEACQAEGLDIDEGYVPIYSQGCVHRYSEWPFIKPLLEKRGIDFKSMHFPVVERICGEEGMWIHQSLLLGPKADMESLVEGFLKVQKHAGEIKKKFD
ncbi:MAG: DegT/DnrJ/EryC1/StrS family aminotransferase [Candidatus Omnitrophica bacterium]|nr:DegT/DnrJ/EryC1/StrS family aminotransferase [Candidatus Omnitrophota bacterium]